MVFSKITSSFGRAGLGFVLLLSAIVPTISLVKPVNVSAAACTVSDGGSGGSGGGFTAFLLRSTSAPFDSSVVEAGIEITPKANWTTDNYFTASGLSLADASCNNLNSGISISLDGTRKLSASYYDSGRSSAFVATTDYDNLFSGVTLGSYQTSTNISFEYTIPTVNADVAQLISVDLSNAGWVDVYLKTGLGTDNLLFSVKAPVGTASFLGRTTTGLSMRYTAINTNSFTSCTDVTGSSELLVKVLADSTPITQTATPTDIPGFLNCPSYDKTSFNSGTGTASLKYDVAGAVVNRVVKDLSLAPKLKTTDTQLQVLSSIALTSDGKDFSTGFYGGTNAASQQLYFGTKELVDGKAIPKDTPWPIVGGVFDMSAKDVDLVAGGVVLDTSLAGYSAVAHNMDKITKDGSFTLFVPYKEGNKYVGVCAGAADLAAVTDKCTGIYYLADGQTKTSANTKSIPSGKSVKATVVTVGTVKFWQVEGLTGSGGFSAGLASDPATGLSVSTTSAPLTIGAVLLTIGAALTARRYALKK